MDTNDAGEEIGRIFGSRIPTATAATPYDDPLLSFINPSEALTDHQSLETSFARLDLSTTHPTLPSAPFASAPPSFDGIVNGPLIMEQPYTPLSLQTTQELRRDQPFSLQTMRELQREIQLRDSMLERMAAYIRAQEAMRVPSQGSGAFDLPLLGPSPLINDPCWNFGNGGFNGECGNPFCSYCLINKSSTQFSIQPTQELPMQFPVRPYLNSRGLPLNSGTHYEGGGMVGLPESELNLSQSSIYNHNIYGLRHHIKYSSLEQLRGGIVAAAKVQSGCRFLQKSFEEKKKGEIRIIFMEVKDHLYELMKDKYGNYFVQRLLDVCNKEQITEVVSSVTKRRSEFKDVCCDKHGTRAVQKLLEFLTTPQQISRVLWVVGLDTLTLSKNVNGHHVIRHCLELFSNENNRYLLRALADNCVEIGTDGRGCCVLQKALEYAHGEFRVHLVDEIKENALVLSEDSFGNYVIQCVMKLKIPYVMASLMKQLERNFVSLSMQQCSSNVVEGFLKFSTKEQSAQIITELINNPNILMLLQDAYGNFVIQTALEVSYEQEQGPIFNSIVDLVEKHYSSLCSNPYGRKVVEKANQLTKKRVQTC